MDKVLIVEDNPVLLKILQTGLKKYEKTFISITAKDGQEAIDILKTTPISLLVTDLQMPKVDGLSLLAFMNDHHPNIPCIVMSAHGTPQLKEKISLDVLRFIEKPFEMDELVQTILSTLEQDEPTGNLNGISIANFLQMIHMERKTCLLEIETPAEQIGYIYFEQGVLFDAVYGEHTGEAAALNIIPHDRVKIRFKNLTRGKKKVNRRILKDLNAVLMESMRRKDEAETRIPVEETLPPVNLEDVNKDRELLEQDDNQDLDSAEIEGADTEIVLDEAADADFVLNDEAAPGVDLDGDAHETGLRRGEIPTSPDAGEPEEMILDVGRPTEMAFSADSSDVHGASLPETAQATDSPPLPSPPQKVAVDTLSRHLKHLFTIGGYRASAILDTGGEMLASDMSGAGAELDLEYTAAMFSNVFRGTRKICEKTGFDDSREMTIVSPKGIVVMLGTPQGESMPFVIILILEPDGNQALARMSIKRILPRIKEALG